MGLHMYIAPTNVGLPIAGKPELHDNWHLPKSPAVHMRPMQPCCRAKTHDMVARNLQALPRSLGRWVAATSQPRTKRCR